MKEETPSPARLALLLALAIVAAEFSLMFLLRFFPARSALQVASADAFVLVAVLSPALYFLLYRPMRRQAEAQFAVERELRNRYRELDLFVENVAHSLRSALHPVVGSAWYLRDRFPDKFKGDGSELLSVIEHGSRKALAMIGDLVSLSRLRKEDLPREPLDIGKAVQEVIRSLDHENSGPVNVVVAGDIPSVSLPRNLLIVVMDNLIRNALSYGVKEGTSVEIFGSRGEGRTLVFVRDHGAGVPEEERKKIFEPLYRGVKNKHQPGTGVGLALVQKIIDLYGGQVRVEETPGGGATFAIELKDD